MFQKREVRLPRGISAEEQLREALDMADAVVIGAGAGLSTSAGFLYSGDRFSGYFGEEVRISRYVYGRVLSV